MNLFSNFSHKSSIFIFYVVSKRNFLLLFKQDLIHFFFFIIKYSNNNKINSIPLYFLLINVINRVQYQIINEKNLAMDQLANVKRSLHQKQ